MKKEFKPEFILIPRVVYENDELKPVDIIVFGVIYWYSALRDGKCTASNATIAQQAGITEGTAGNSILRLEEQGFIKRSFKDETKATRLNIKCLISIKVGTPDDEPGTSDDGAIGTSIDEQNNNILNNNITTNVVTAKKQVKEINLLLDFLKSKLGSERLDGSVLQNRRYAWLCLKKFGPDPPNMVEAYERTKKVINLAFRDPFHAARSTDMKYIFYNGMKIVSTAKEKMNKENNYIL